MQRRQLVLARGQPVRARRRSGQLIELLAVIAVLGIMSGALAMARGTLRPPTAFEAAAGAAPATMLADAAAKFEAARSPSGSGYAFEIVSRSTLHARPGGPKIEIPDPKDPDKVLALADEYYVGGSVASGIVIPGGYNLTMRAGPSTPDAQPDFEKSEITLASLVRDGTSWRNDGLGWYETDTLPGIGLDPRTIERLPSLLREAQSAEMKEPVDVDGKILVAVTGEGLVANAPGLMAVDAEPFTEFVEPIQFAIDDQGRLGQLIARMRNTNSEVFDLIVETTITFDYENVPSELPRPEPLAPPAPPPAADPADTKG